MNSHKESPEQLIILVSGMFSMISCIMSILATTTSGWQVDSHHNKTGLFQTCYRDTCTSIKEKHYLPILFASLGQCLIGLGIVGSFVYVFLCQHRIGPILTTVFFFLASIFLWIAVLTINLFLFLNGGSAIIFNAAIVFLLLATLTASYALGASLTPDKNSIHSPVRNAPMEFGQISLPFEFYRHTPTGS